MCDSDTLCLQSGLSPSLILLPFGGSFSSVLPESSGILAVLHAVEGDVDNGNQALGGAQEAE